MDVVVRLVAAAATCTVRSPSVTNNASGASPVRSSVTGPTMPAVVMDWPHPGATPRVAASTSGPTIRPGSPPGRLSDFSVPLMARLRWSEEQRRQV